VPIGLHDLLKLNVDIGVRIHGGDYGFLSRNKELLPFFINDCGIECQESSASQNTPNQTQLALGFAWA